MFVAEISWQISSTSTPEQLDEISCGLLGSIANGIDLILNAIDVDWSQIFLVRLVKNILMNF